MVLVLSKVLVMNLTHMIMLPNMYYQDLYMTLKHASFFKNMSKCVFIYIYMYIRLIKKASVIT